VSAVNAPTRRRRKPGERLKPGAEARAGRGVGGLGLRAASQREAHEALGRGAELLGLAARGRRRRVGERAVLLTGPGG
jgi:hypothetical protein